MAVRQYTQQTIDRIVGTATLIGLSIAAIRWLSQVSKQRRAHQQKLTLPWWWPVIALRRRNSRRMKNNEDGICELEHVKAREMNMESGHEHRGSCHCRSIQFLLRGPQNLQAIDSPGKIRYPHIPTTAVQFHLLRGESEMMFYYIDDKTDSSIAGSTIASNEPDYNFENDDDIHNNHTQQQSAGAHGFCSNCGVHILRAPSRSSEDLEINANCLEDGGKVQCTGADGNVVPLQRSPTAPLLSSGKDHKINKSLRDEEKVKSNHIQTVNEYEQLLGGSANFWESLDHRPAPPGSDMIPFQTKERSDSIQNSYVMTQSITESDDFSMGSSSMASSLHMLSVASCHVGVPPSDSRVGLPPLPSSSGMSAKTLPPRFGESKKVGCNGGRSVGAGVNGTWSIASMESDDLDANVDKSSVTPKMMYQMKYYMSRHMAKPK